MTRKRGLSSQRQLTTGTIGIVALGGIKAQRADEDNGALPESRLNVASLTLCSLTWGIPARTADSLLPHLVLEQNGLSVLGT